MSGANRFLIVNRDLHLQDLLVLLLRSRRVPAVGVTTGEEASIAARLICFDAVLFDVASREDWDSLARLRKELSREVPIVALSGCVSKDGTYRKHARALGCVAFVAKPATVAMTVQALQGAASGSRWSE